MTEKELYSVVDSEDSIKHYGVKRRSGRYPWGSGENPYQHSGDFLSRYEAMKKAGLTEKEIAANMNIDSTTDLRSYIAVAKHERRQLQVATAKSLKSDGLGYSEIGRKMGINESTVRSLLNTESEKNMNASIEAAEFLKKTLNEKGMIDVGAGVEHVLSDAGIKVSKNKLEEALVILQGQGYNVYGIGVQQITNPNQQTNIRVLCPKDMSYSDAYKNRENIQSVGSYISADGELVIESTWHYPESLDSKRIKIRYAEEGGLQKDGVIELRRNVKDISLGESKYSQVRILVDGTHYLKGMAVYSDGEDMPEGVDVIFNTNKKLGTPQGDVFKKIKKDDPDNPFGTYIKRNGQSWYDDEDGNRKLSVINKARDEGDWQDWNNKLSSQFLSKQNVDLAKRQLDLSYIDHVAEFDEIKSLTNPTLKRHLLNEFAGSCDSAAVHLQAAALPRQRFQVILPITSMKDDEIYAPNFNDGEKVALVRYPHGGTFEIPILTVNNKNSEGKKVISNSATDAVGINSSVAERLSGADFDGDTVLVIPTNSKIKITSKNPLEGLQGFDPKTAYGKDKVISDENGVEHYYRKDGKEYKIMNNTQTEMGKVSNLITDMTLKGATENELARAVRHSMVVIDAEKHKLDYRQSYIDNGIAELKSKYQGRIENGKYTESASTLISRASSEVDVIKRKGNPNINPNTGESTYKEISYINDKGEKITRPSKEVIEEYRVPAKDKNGNTLKDEDGKVIFTDKVKIRTQKSTQMAETKDAHTLSSGTKMESLYADYANHMKSLANEARKEAIRTGNIVYDKEAAKLYSKEVASLNAKLNTAEKNAPRERQAQIIATKKAKALLEDNPAMSKEDYKKIKQQALSTARVLVGASGKDTRIEITDSEWKAIQSGAISDTKLSKILLKADSEDVRKRATPKATNELSEAKINRIKAMSNSGHTNAEIAKILGVSATTVSNYLKGGN